MIQYKRLKKLADYLSKPKLPSGRKFDFGTVNDGKVEFQIDGNKIKVKPGSCGTAGCAMGELPFCFPKDWKYPEPEIDVCGDEIVVTNNLQPQRVGGNYATISGFDWSDASDYFGVIPDVVSDLFDVNDVGDKSPYGGFKKLGPRAKAKQVAANIRTFIAWAKKSRSNAESASL